jgi:hypothetical protein
MHAASTHELVWEPIADLHPRAGAARRIRHKV